jgi:hypothetical protein
MTPDQTRSFQAGEQRATRVASCTARRAALELMKDARWWNRRRRGLMARALIAHAEELEVSAAASTPGAQAG